MKRFSHIFTLQKGVCASIGACVSIGACPSIGTYALLPLFAHYIGLMLAAHMGQRIIQSFHQSISIIQEHGI